MAKPAWAQNAVIIQDNGNSVDYRPKCPYCGEIPWGTTMRGAHAPEGGRSNTNTICSKCGKSFTISLGRG